ncbi:MAG: (d)CMP kinase [Clostridiales bacterium]|nr:(d)CMP kinase [Clostridiales bacterium]MCF8023226.1 (d)CMP kinase [Clostridiales bacterium]
MEHDFQIAIDGPAGAGKSTVAVQVAVKLGFLYIDTGAIYRAVTFAAVKSGIDLADSDAVAAAAAKLNVEMYFDREKLYRIYIDGEDVTGNIRTPEISRNVSTVAQIPAVREALLDKQRNMAAGGRVVMEGRDIGTSVLPRAEYKFFLTASSRERAMRRHRELVSQGYGVTFESMLEDIQQRDNADSLRSISPLKPAPDAIHIDCSETNVEQVVDFIVLKVTGGKI